MIAVEQAGRRPAADLGRQLPGQVGGVLQPEVEALSAGRVVDVGRVPGQQHPPGPVAGGLPGRVADPAQPRVRGLPHAEVGAGHPLRARPQVFERHRPVGRVEQRRVVDHRHPVPSAAQRHHVQRAARLVQGERRGLRRVGQLDVAEDRLPGVRGPLEIDPGGGPDHALGAVAARDVGGADDDGPVGRVHVEVDARVGRPQAGHGVLAQVRHAQLGQVLLEQFLGPPLREEQRVGVAGAGVEEGEVKPVLQQREMRRRHRPALGQPAVGDPAHRELLDRARVDRERLRVRRPLFPALEHNRPDARAVQFGREPQADRSAADHGDVVVMLAGGVHVGGVHVRGVHVGGVHAR